MVISSPRPEPYCYCVFLRDAQIGLECQNYASVETKRCSKSLLSYLWHSNVKNKFYYYFGPFLYLKDFPSFCHKFEYNMGHLMKNGIFSQLLSPDYWNWHRIITGIRAGALKSIVKWCILIRSFSQVFAFTFMSRRSLCSLEFLKYQKVQPN